MWRKLEPPALTLAKKNTVLKFANPSMDPEALKLNGDPPIDVASSWLTSAEQVLQTCGNDDLARPAGLRSYNCGKSRKALCTNGPKDPARKLEPSQRPARRGASDRSHRVCGAPLPQIRTSAPERDRFRPAVELRSRPTLNKGDTHALSTRRERVICGRTLRSLVDLSTCRPGGTFHTQSTAPRKPTARRRRKQS